MPPVKRLIISIAVAFIVGLGLSYVWYAPTDEQTQALAGKQERITAPEGGVRTAAFPLALLKSTMKLQPEGNVVVAPDSLTGLLQILLELSDGPAKAALEALGLPQELAQTAILPSEVALIHPDSAIPLRQDLPIGKDIQPAPFSTDLGAAYVTMDRALSLFSEGDLGGSGLSSFLAPDSRTAPLEAGDKATNPGISIVALQGISFHEPWMQTPRKNKIYKTDFTNANTTSSIVYMVKHEGNYRVARAADGSWVAAAIFFRNSLPQGQSACLVVVMPTDGNVRAFVEKVLTPEKLTEIRTALLDQPAQSCTVEFPAIEFGPVSQDMTPVLKDLGLGCLFTEASPFPELAGQAKAPLTMVIQQVAVALKDDQGLDTAPEPAETGGGRPTAVKFDHPFFWYIGDLTSDRPPYLMGIIEQL